MSKVRSCVALAGALLLCACAVVDGSPYGDVDPQPDPTSPSTFVGRVAGQHLDAQDSFARVVHDPQLGDVTAIEIVDYLSSCPDYTNSTEHRGSLHLTLLIGLQTSQGTLAPAAAGPYTVFDEQGSSGGAPPPGAFAIARFSGRDASCAVSGQASWNGASGTVTVATISAGALQGTYDLTMHTGDHITGRFFGAPCAEPGSASTVCK